MRVERLELLAYGHYAGTELDLSEPKGGLTIVVGPNEAGKSTARRALVAALWGFARGATDAYRYEPAGLRLGMTLRSERGAELHAVRLGSGRGRLAGADGSALGEDAVSAFLGGATRELYERLFCVDHDELRVGSEALLDAGGEIGRLVFGAALGARPLGEVLRRLDARAGELYKETGRRQPVVESLAAYREAMRRSRELRVRSRDVDRLRHAADDARDRVESLRSTLEERRAELARHERVRTALPLVAQRDELRRALEELGGQLPLPVSGWASRAEAAQAAAERLDEGRRAVLARRAKLEAQISAISVDSAVVERAPQIDRVVEGLDRYKNNAEDLPERHGRLRVAAQRLEDCHRRLGVTHMQAVDDWVVSDAQLLEVESLATLHAALEQAVRTAAGELSTLEIEIEEGVRRVETLPEPADVAGLVRAVDLASPLVTRAADLLEVREEINRRRADAAAAAGRLGLGIRSLEEIEALPAPTSAEVSTAIGDEQVLAERRKALEQERERHARIRQDRARELEALAGRPGVPDPGRLAAARSRREAGWMLVRRALFGESGEAFGGEVAEWSAGGVEPASDAPGGLAPAYGASGSASGDASGDQGELVSRLAGAYEAAVADVDAAADERHAHAEDLSKLGQLEAQIQEAAIEEAGAGRRLSELEGDVEALRRRWAERWARIGVEPGSPAEMVKWPEGHGQLLGVIEKVNVAEQRANASAQAVAQATELVSAALERAGVGTRPPPGTPLEMLVAQAREIVGAAADQSKAREGAQGDLERARASLTARSRELAEVRTNLGDWKRRWSAALEPLRLDAETSPPAALETVRALRELANVRSEVAELEGRIRGIERDMDAFGSLVQQVASGLGLQGAGDPLATAAALREGLHAARAALASSAALEGQLADVVHELEGIETELGASAHKLRDLRDEARCGPDADIRAVAERARRADELRRQIATREKTLLEQGGGRTLDEILAEMAASGSDGDRLAAHVASLSDEIDALESDLETANRALGEARRDLDAVTDAGSAADSEQEAQSHLAVAASAAAEYARTAVAATVLRQVVVAYGQQHRGPILERAGTIFSDVTGGAFAQLLTDAMGDQQVVLAQRRNGEACTVGQMSDGARDQLYFALRLAGIEYQLSHLHEPLPVVFDDVLVNFDDRRTGVALRTLASLGSATQVVLFTHHAAVAAAAREAIEPDRLAVRHLDARDHDTPVSNKGPTWAAARLEGPVRPGSPRGRPGTQSAEAILEIIVRAGGPVSKADAVAAGIPEERWSHAIRRLVDTGAVVQEGAKRGARYRLAAG